jgi:transcriptional regulator with XRE-family HTH domain
MSSEQKRRIGEEVRRLRLERGMTLEQLAYLSGLSFPTVHRIESLRRRKGSNVELNTLNAIARALGKKVKVEFVD